MQLHTVQRLHPSIKKSARVGRGGKRGTTSGRGQKGQGAHGGRRIPTGFKEIFQRLPKLRGVNNRPLHAPTTVINLDVLVKKVINKSIITKQWLVQQSFLDTVHQPVKILGDGALTVAITVIGIPVSASARTKIEKAGGTIR